MPERNPEATGGKPRHKPSGCKCTNRNGGAKQQHKTRDAAVLDATRKLNSSGTTRVYPCPTSNRWHVTTH